jgi:hypothetical protein
MLIVRSARRADREFEVEKEESMTVGDFHDWVRGYYQIVGELTLYYKEKKLDDRFAALGTIVPPGQTLRIAFDKTKRKAAGGYGTAGEGNGGKNASGEGAIATGGHGDQNHTFGGGSKGGNATGTSGTGGAAFGGPATAGPGGGIARGGNASGGDWTFE